ncbi:MAG TPA: cytidine/deoxycytidylate deaminase family protein [Candidatus Paceibacterota bacterium]|jgi:dCMP deaminase|nr:cytidine/deoxycytidylate deaminase family protein [Candidatus Paceibacterota bacterium]
MPDKNPESSSYIRPSWDEYFLQMAELIGSRGTCDRGRAGAIIVKNKRILSTGYVGSPVGLPHCDEVGHEMHTVTQEDGIESRHCIRTAHAEQNAISNAARVGVAIEGGTMYCKMIPCYKCGQSIINSGIVRVVALKDYHGASRTKEIFDQAGIEYKILGEMEIYKDM